MVVITVEGAAKPFNCSVGWTMKEAEKKIRKMYGLKNGGILRNGVGTRSKDVIQEGEGIAYVFVGGKMKQSAPQQGKRFHSLISSIASTLSFFRSR